MVDALGARQDQNSAVLCKGGITDYAVARRYDFAGFDVPSAQSVPGPQSVRSGGCRDEVIAIRTEGEGNERGRITLELGATIRGSQAGDRNRIAIRALSPGQKLS